MKKFKKIPKFKSPAQEDDFCRMHDSSKYIDWNHSQQATFPNLKNTLSQKVTISDCI